MMRLEKPVLFPKREYENFFTLKDEKIGETYTIFKSLITQLAVVGVTKTDMIQMIRFMDVLSMEWQPLITSIKTSGRTNELKVFMEGSWHMKKRLPKNSRI